MSSHARLCFTLLVLPFIARADEPRVDASGDPLPPGALVRLGSTRWRPGGTVEFMAFSPDGRQLTTIRRGMKDEYVVWDVATGRPLRRVPLSLNVEGHPTQLANGRIVLVDSYPRGSAVGVRIHTDPSQPPFEPERYNSPLEILAWPPTGDEYDPRRTSSPVVVSAVDKAANEDEYFCFALSPDGRHLAGGRRAGKEPKPRPIDVWELTADSVAKSDVKSWRFAMQPDDCNMLAYTPGGRTLLAISIAKRRKEQNFPVEFTAVAWDTATGHERRRFTVPRLPWRASSSSGAIWFEPPAVSEKFVAFRVWGDDDAVRVWGLEGGPDRRIVTGHTRRGPRHGVGPAVVAFAPDGKLVTGGRDGVVKFWDAATGKELHWLLAYDGPISALAVSRDGKRLAVAGSAGIIRHFDLTTSDEINITPGPKAALSGVALTADGKTAVTTGHDSRVHFWDVASGRELCSRPLEPGLEPPQLTLAPNGRTVLVADGHRLRAWDATTYQASALPKPLSELACHGTQFSDDGRLLAAFHRGDVTLVDWPSGKVKHTIKLRQPFLMPGMTRAEVASFSPDGRQILLVTTRYEITKYESVPYPSLDDLTVGLWDVATGRHVADLITSQWPACTATYMPTGEVFAVVNGYSAELRPRDGGPPRSLSDSFFLIDPATGKVKRSAKTSGRYAFVSSGPRQQGLILAPDGRSLLSANESYGSIRVYELATAEESGTGLRRELLKHYAGVTVVACTRGGRRLISGSEDMTALVWDISLTGFLPKTESPSAKAQAELWESLGHEDVSRALGAMSTLAHHPAVAVDLVRSHLKPIPAAPDEPTLDRLVTDLAAEKYAARFAAERALTRFGPAAAAGLRSRLPKVTSTEARRRIDLFLAQHDPPETSNARLRECRALELLEQINTPESRAVLKDLATGATDAPLPRAAALSLRRAQAITP